MPATIALSLISHTNVGKTTLARTLLGRDIGEVRDEAHVTLEAQRHSMIETPEGDRLELWDTPGFGDSVRLAKRLAGAGNPIGWFLLQVWDRYRDRAFWSSQRAMRNIVEEADVVLYLIDASQATDDAGYLDAELRVLDLIGKPVVVLLNQLGAPQAPADEAAIVDRWRARMGTAKSVRTTLALDAFSRCWVQEGVLLDAVAAALPAARHAAMGRLRAGWAAQRTQTWHAAMAELAARVARAALDREAVSNSRRWTERMSRFAAALGLPGATADTPQSEARERLAARLDAEIVQSTDRLIRLHGLDGRATRVVLARLAEHYSVAQPVSEGAAGLWSGIVAGVLAGLKADIVSGGLTLGGGMLAGGVIGALGGVGVAKGANRLRGIDVTTLRWDDKMLDELVRSALLGYLAVAHHGRGRGEWSSGEPPMFWLKALDGVFASRRAALDRLWAKERRVADDAAKTTSATLGVELEAWLIDASEALLRELYPSAWQAAAARA